MPRATKESAAVVEQFCHRNGHMRESHMLICPAFGSELLIHGQDLIVLHLGEKLTD